MGSIGFTHQAYLPHVLTAALFIFLLCCALVWRRNSKLSLRSRHNKGRIYGTLRMIVAGMVCSLIGLCLGLLVLEPYRITPESRKVYAPVDIVIADDKSLSVLAQATADQCGPSRLEIGQQEIERFIDLIEKERAARLGLVVFTRFGYRYVPVLTKDYALFRRMLKDVDEEELMSGGFLSGTNHWHAIVEAAKIFETGKVKNKRLLIIVTDGEPDAPQKVLDKSRLEALEAMRLLGRVEVYIVGLGNPSVRYPIPKSRDQYRCPKEFFIQEEGPEQGQVIMTQPDVNQLEAMAAQLGGRYIHSRTGLDLSKLLEGILVAERRQVGVETVPKKHDLTAMLVKTTLALLLIFIFLKTP